MAKENYHDMDGNRISLKHLCEQEPKWAENTVRYLKAETEKLKPTGNWTTTPPTETGWYRIHDKCRYGFGFARVANGRKGKLIYQIDGVRDEQPLIERSDVRWWSIPETFPPLPEDGGANAD